MPIWKTLHRSQVTIQLESRKDIRTIVNYPNSAIREKRIWNDPMVGSLSQYSPALYFSPVKYTYQHIADFTEKDDENLCNISKYALVQ